MPRLTLIKEWNALPIWTDSISVIRWTDGFIHGIGGAIHANLASGTHYVFDDNGNIIHEIPNAVTPVGEQIVSTVISGKIVAGLGSITGSQEVFVFDPSIAGYTAASWSLLGDVESAIGKRTNGVGFDYNGWFYLVGGGRQDNWVKTQDFVTWTVVGTLPTNMKKIAGPGCCVKGTKAYYVGGSTNMPNTGDFSVDYLNGDFDGRIWEIDMPSETITEIGQDIPKFGQVWLDMAATDNAIYTSCGYVSATNAPGQGLADAQNIRGFYRSTDGGSSWTAINLQASNEARSVYYEKHRTSMVKISATKLFAGFGFQGNKVWHLDESLS